MYDEKTPHLKLPLPHASNTLDEDLPRLRESFGLLDSEAELAAGQLKKLATHTHSPEEAGAAPANHSHTPAQAGAAPANHTHAPEQAGAAPADHSHTPAQVGAAPASHGHTPEQAGAAPAGHSHTAAQVGAYSKDQTDAAIKAKGGGFNSRLTITSSGTFTVPANGYYKVTCIGGGGKGSAGISGTTSATRYSPGAGGGAGYVTSSYVYLTAGTEITLTVGAGATSSTGGTTSFINNALGISITAAGGQGGGTASRGGAQGGRGQGNGGNGNACGYLAETAVGGTGGTGGSNGTPYGGGGGGGAGGSSSSSFISYGGLAGGNGTNGSNGSGTNAGTGGNGGPGVILIEYYDSTI